MIEIPSAFPTLFDWWFWTPLVFRLFLGVALLQEAVSLLKSNQPEIIVPDNTAPSPPARMALMWLLGIVGIMLLVGIGTQLAAAFAGAMFLVRWYQLSSYHEEKAAIERRLSILMGLVSFSLIILGPGPFSIDLPF